MQPTALLIKVTKVKLDVTAMTTSVFDMCCSRLRHFSDRSIKMQDKVAVL